MRPSKRLERDSCLSSSLTSTACPRNPDPGHHSAATNRCSQEPNRNQTARGQIARVDNDRDIHSPSRHKGIRRGGQDVSTLYPSYKSHDWSLKRLPTRYCRFVFSPIPELEKGMGIKTTDLKKEVDNLGKKLQYLETTHKNSREHINQIFQSGGGRT